MTTDRWFIADIDHRISIALIFFFLLLLIGNKMKRPLFPVRARVSLGTLCTVSWFIRTVTDIHLSGVIMQGIGHSDGIHHSTQHTHSIGMATLHLISAVLDTTPEITGTNHKTNLYTHIHTFLDGFAYRIDHRKIQTSMSRTSQGFAADLQHDSFILDLRQA